MTGSTVHEIFVQLLTAEGHGQVDKYLLHSKTSTNMYKYRSIVSNPAKKKKKKITSLLLLNFNDKSTSENFRYRCWKTSLHFLFVCYLHVNRGTTNIAISYRTYSTKQIGHFLFFYISLPWCVTC